MITTVRRAVDADQPALQELFLAARCWLLFRAGRSSAMC